MLLDGRDDVAHPAAPRAAEGGHQGAVADDDHPLGRLGDHQVVLDPEHQGVAATQHAAAYDAVRVDRGGAVERRRRGSAPVDDQRLVLVVAHAQPADVPDLVLQVQASEDQAFVLGLQRLAPTAGVEHQRVPLEEAGHLVVADRAAAVAEPAAEALGLHEPRALAGLAELDVDAIDMLLFVRDLGRDLRRDRWGGRAVGHAHVAPEDVDAKDR
ncbi:hypothetical protein [Allobranchiibius sp. GilTou73]|uniref:hypothetical protein n=1 Tax=Allobranchiibius sp. GilTou73 TaxID=2904523 RepID=UPI00351D9C0E